MLAKPRGQGIEAADQRHLRGIALDRLLADKGFVAGGEGAGGLGGHGADLREPAPERNGAA